MRHFVILICILNGLVPGSHAADWVCWRGPDGLGVSAEKNLPVQWSKEKNMATPTPVSDGERVWALFGTGDLACLDRAGKVLWQRNLVKEYGEYKTNHGYGTSPMLLDGRLFIACMHQGPSYLLALDAQTGKNLWKKERSLEPKDEAQDSYSSPLFLRADGRAQVVLAGAESVNAYDPAV